ncbi:hypothetical protein yrohd0001_12040 [Yersinia rohdei ATCC 43380]|nr:hypothetical protein yrohd0001_12040 [Yersinia rohdei ATCC 43380]
MPVRKWGRVVGWHGINGLFNQQIHSDSCILPDSGCISYGQRVY